MALFSRYSMGLIFQHTLIGIYYNAFLLSTFFEMFSRYILAFNYTYFLISLNVPWAYYQIYTWVFCTLFNISTVYISSYAKL